MLWFFATLWQGIVPHVEKVIALDNWPVISRDLRMPVSHPGSLCGRTWYVWMSEVSGEKTGSRLRWSTFPQLMTPQVGNQVSIFHDNIAPSLTVSGMHRVTVAPVRIKQSLICVLVVRSK